MEEMAMLLNGYDLDLDLEGRTKLPPVVPIEEAGTKLPINSSSNDDTTETNTNGTIHSPIPSNGEASSDEESTDREEELMRFTQLTEKHSNT